MRRIIAFVVLAAALTACDEPNDACNQEGKSKHYSTGHILTCKNGKWVLERGVGFER